MSRASARIIRTSPQRVTPHARRMPISQRRERTETTMVLMTAMVERSRMMMGICVMVLMTPVARNIRELFKLSLELTITKFRLMPLSQRVPPA